MAGTWQGLINQPPFSTGTMILLTDGRIMVQEGGSNHWHALKPDSSGSYLNGTWSKLADSIHSRLYYASGVLKDARVIFGGGEYSDAGGETNACEIYDPVADSWAVIPSPPGWAQVGDAASCVLPDGRFMIGALSTPKNIIYDPLTNSWTPAADKAIRSNEETWVLLPDNTIVTVQCFAPHKSEKYIIATNTWKDEGALPVAVVNPNMAEIGPAMLLYNGKTIYFGAENVGGFGKTIIYTMPAAPGGTGTWVTGPNIPHVGPDIMVSNDCPASLMPNGKVLFTASKYFPNDWGAPTYFFEYDPVGNTIVQAPTPPNNGSVVYQSRMMLLPSGEIMFSPSSNNVQVYVPDGGPIDPWRPTIDSITPHVNGMSIIDYYVLKGTQLNGLSQANMFGDDCSPSTNYPLVRMTNTCSGKVYYARSYDFSTMGVATGNAMACCNFSTAGIPDGEYSLAVVANGISSLPVTVQFPMPLDKECCSCSEININLPAICEDCVAPPAPEWLPTGQCMYWYEYRFFQKIILGGGKLTNVERLIIQFRVTYEHKLCMIGRQQGALLFTTTLLPQEELKIYQNDRYRRTRAESERVSLHASLRQTTAAVHETKTKQTENDFTEVIANVRSSGDSTFTIGGGLFPFSWDVNSPDASFSVDVNKSTSSVSEDFRQSVVTSSQMVEAERSFTVSTFEDSEHTTITSRTLKNNNDCRAVTYYVRRVNEVYKMTTRVINVEWRVPDGKTFTDWRSMTDFNGVNATLQDLIVQAAVGLPKIGDEVSTPNSISVPTDGAVYEAELAHCCSCDPEREAQLLIALEKSKNESRKLCMEAELMEMEVQRRKALLAQGNLAPFDPPVAP
jgi:hypothetical protein